MTPQQQNALEALVGRALTGEEVTAIDGHLATGSVGAVAALLSQGRERVVRPTYIGDGTVSDVIGASGAGPYAALYLRRQALLAESISDATLAAMTDQQRYGLALLWQAWHRLSAGSLDIGLPSVRAILPSMVGVIPGLTSEHVATLLALAEQPDPISANQVSAALAGV